jgi:hypothetical protein
VNKNLYKTLKLSREPLCLEAAKELRRVVMGNERMASVCHLWEAFALEMKNRELQDSNKKIMERNQKLHAELKAAKFSLESMTACRELDRQQVRAAIIERDDTRKSLKISEAANTLAVAQLKNQAYLISFMLNALPADRDWLDPDIEAALRRVVGQLVRHNRREELKRDETALRASQEAQLHAPLAPRLRAHLIVEHRPGCAWITSLANEHCDCGATSKETIKRG